MYKVSLAQLIRVLDQAGHTAAIQSIHNAGLTEDAVITAEIDFETQPDYIHVNEFNIFTSADTVLFGELTKHGDDFTLNWAPTKPRNKYDDLSEHPWLQNHQ